MKNWLYIFILCLSMWIASCQHNSTDRAIMDAVEKQMEMYPKSTLRDLYKNFFQDYFGPGHIIANTDAANNYLRQELSSVTEFEGDDYEYTGYRGKMVRVNLKVIADGRVPYDKYLDAFLRSVNGITPPSIEEWKAEWAKIDSVIMTMDIVLDNAEKDRQEITQLLNENKFVMHHSRQFNEHYAPHYRIIERKIFEEEILPLIGKNNKKTN
ncbi:MAG: hypothetical protein IIW60_06825 [Alistipes sp.]|nr:hypothetical protein [Alistipes sp.]